MAATSKDDFVDLYEVLELPTDAESETIRQRLNTLYLEAQQNLDHRNAKKRLQYQQMYEVYLPQARHLLLDARRRTEYDRYLTAYRTGHKVAPSAPAESEMPMPSSSPAVEEPPLPGMAEVDPAVLAAEREDMWAKWKHGLEAVTESETEIPTPPPVAAPAARGSSTAQAEAAAPASTPAIAPPPFARRRPPPQRSGSASPSRPTPPQRPPSPRSASPRANRTPGIGVIGEEEQVDLEAQREAERRQDLEKQRYQITKEAVQTAGLLWGAAYAIGILLLGCALLFVLIGRIKNFPLGLSSSAFSGVCLLVILAAAGGGGLLARRKAKRRKALELSLLPIEELLRRSRS